MFQTAPEHPNRSLAVKLLSVAALLKDAARHARDGAPDLAARVHHHLLAMFPKTKPLRRALKADPTNADARNNIGAVMHGAKDIPAALQVIGQKDAAKTCHWENLKLDPGEPSAVLGLACVAKGEDVPSLRPHLAQLLEPAMAPDTQMAGAYMVSRGRPRRERHVVDKTPLNFRYAGFIARALPEAKLIHLRRRADSLGAAGQTRDVQRVFRGLVAVRAMAG